MPREIQEGSHVAVRGKPDAAPPAPVAAVGPAELHEFFPPEGEGSVASGPGLDENLNFVYKTQEGNLAATDRVVARG